MSSVYPALQSGFQLQLRNNLFTLAQPDAVCIISGDSRYPPSTHTLWVIRFTYRFIIIILGTASIVHGGIPEVTRSALGVATNPVLHHHYRTGLYLIPLTLHSLCYHDL